MMDNLTLNQKLQMALDAGYRIEWDTLDSWSKVYCYHRPNGERVLVGGKMTKDKDSVILAMWEDYQKRLEADSTTDYHEERKSDIAAMSREELEQYALTMAREQDHYHDLLKLIPECPEHGHLCSSHAKDWVKAQLEPVADPMKDHKCEMIAKCYHMAEGREIWLGKLLEPIKGYPAETHCLHVTTPAKSVVFGIMHGDTEVLAVLAQIVHKDVFGTDKPINQHWIDLQEASYRAEAKKANAKG